MLNKVAAVYARVSGPDDPRTASIESRIEGAASKAAELGYAVAWTFTDRFTGMEIWDRPALTELREGIRPASIRRSSSTPSTGSRGRRPTTPSFSKKPSGSAAAASRRPRKSTTRPKAT